MQKVGGEAARTGKAEQISARASTWLIEMRPTTSQPHVITTGPAGR